MKSVHLEWNCNCSNCWEHEVRCEIFELGDNRFKEIRECESCDYECVETWTNK